MSKPKRSDSPVKVLFIGNSFTARNNLPGMVERLAAARGKTLRHDLISAGGASLRAHWNAGHALKAVQVGRYDFVVLQEQSTLPIKNAVRMHENVRLFDEAIRNAGSKTVLYMTWARQHSPGSQQIITDAYLSIGKELNATVVPVGTAWKRVLDKHDLPVLYDRDQSHPTVAGSYLAACVFFAVLFGESPVGLNVDIPGVDEEAKVLMQKAAWYASKTALKQGKH